MISFGPAGGKSASKATYIPNSYARAQNAWIDSFYTSNGYLEVLDKQVL